MGTEQDGIIFEEGWASCLEWRLALYQITTFKRRKVSEFLTFLEKKNLLCFPYNIQWTTQGPQDVIRGLLFPNALRS